MHYRNGRPAKNGDKVLMIPSYGSPVIGILHDAVAGNDDCNGMLAPIGTGDQHPDLKDCLHWDDVKALLAGTVPDTSGTEGG